MALSRHRADGQPAQQPAAAKKFLNYLDSTEAGDIFKKFGFTLRD